MNVLSSYMGRLVDVSKSIMIGMGITWRYLVSPDEIVTIQYGSKKYGPTERYLPDRHRGIHYLETEKCVMCWKCSDICPVDCIYEGPEQLYIHPEECIDCGACEPECPVSAIFMEDVDARFSKG